MKPGMAKLKVRYCPLSDPELTGRLMAGSVGWGWSKASPVTGEAGCR